MQVDRLHMPFARRFEAIAIRPSLLALLCLVSVLGAGSACAADEPSEVARLHASGQSAAALLRADEYLATHPRDAQMRFAKAVILGDTSRGSEAATLLEKLTEDYPDLPEPYNNLAVLHAAAGLYAQARRELEQALRLDPGYATAHENLGDVQLALARDSYATALRLEPSRPGLAAKIARASALLPPAPAASATASVRGAARAASAPAVRR
jgi:tetratricopeptide (TPR) repeat protein